MAQGIHVEIAQPRILGETLRIEGRIVGHPSEERNGTLFFEIPARAGEWSAIRGRGDDLHDAFLRATIWSAMEAGGELVVHGRVSSRLLANLERHQEIVRAWWPVLRPVDLRADVEVGDADAAASVGSDEAHRRSAVLAFSGGLDSTESLVAHRRGWRGRNTVDVRACVFVHGFDIPLGDGAFAGAYRRAESVTAHYGVELVPVRCNAKELLPSWELTYPSATLAAVSLFERRGGVGLFASSRPYEDFTWVAAETGSTPLTDGLLSSATFTAVHDLGAWRVEKTARLAGEAAVWRDLRVCWEGEDLTGNCGRCEKCIRQMLCMWACGVADFSAFRRPLTPRAVSSARIVLAVVRAEWERCLAAAASRGLAGEAVFAAAREVVERDRGVVNATAHHAGLWFRARRRLLRRWPGLPI